ncbi:hypothetical protein JD969_09695 [Planctomycetota bacterium]|nr:hypothetical protein JD969_09695 [Planctomycetota bacterium]
MKRMLLIITITILTPLILIAALIYSSSKALNNAYPYTKKYEEVSYPHVTYRHTPGVGMLTNLDRIPLQDTTHLYFFLDRKKHHVFNYQFQTTAEQIKIWIESEPTLKSLTPRTDSFTLPYNQWTLTDPTNQPLITKFRFYQYQNRNNNPVSILIDDQLPDDKMVYITIDMSPSTSN